VTDGSPGERALALIDKLLAERPEKVGHDFSEATRCLSAYRDELIGRFRKTGAKDDRARLDGANAVLSVIVSGHFPLGDIPWGHIEEARKRLAGLVHARPD
jgi:formate dehydrogenase major subunit